MKLDMICYLLIEKNADKMKYKEIKHELQLTVSDGHILW